MQMLHEYNMYSVCVVCQLTHVIISVPQEDGKCGSHVHECECALNQVGSHRAADVCHILERRQKAY